VSGKLEGMFLNKSHAGDLNVEFGNIHGKVCEFLPDYRVSDQYVYFALTIFSNPVASSRMMFAGTAALNGSVAVNVGRS